MAGEGRRFKEAGYDLPKPLVNVAGIPMIQRVIENIGIKGRYIFIVQKQHYTEYNLKSLLDSLAPNNVVIEIDNITQGAACSVLLAKELINTDSPLLIANSDQYVEWNPFEFINLASKHDGGILTFNDTSPKWSYVKTTVDRIAIEVAEKNPISNNATVGIYYWTQGKDYVKYAEEMISKNIRTNNEFYVCPVYNQAIQDGKSVVTYPVNKMWGLGTPEDLDAFLTHETHST
jgi:NDP-sugar pyrophosphorylase family protein